MRSNGPPLGWLRLTSAWMSAVAEGSAEPWGSVGPSEPKSIAVAASHRPSKRPFGIAALTLRQFLPDARTPRTALSREGVSPRPGRSWLPDGLPVDPGSRRTDVVV